MKNLTTIILLALALEVNGQIGSNYVNLDTYGDSLSMVWTCEASNYIVPIRLRTDKEQSPELQTATLDKAKMFHRIALQQGKQAEFVYTVNLWATPETNLQGVKILKDYGCTVNVIEVGNEYYSWIKKDYGSIDFSYYQPKAEALRSVLVAAYPSLIFVYPACPSPKGSGIAPERQDHKNWNEALKVMLDKYPNDSYVWHVYYDSYDAPVLADAEKGLTKQVLNGANSYLQAFYESYYNGCINSTLFDKSFNYADSLFKRKGYFTEYGTVGSGNIRNTLTYGTLVFRDGVKFKDKTFLYVHSGISLTGVIQPKNAKFDTQLTTNIRRVEYYALQLANECVNALPLLENNVLHEGVNYFYFTGNVNAGFSGNYQTTFETRLVTGQYLYSSAGATAFMANGTPKSNEITGIQTFAGINTPDNSFGYVKVICLPLDVYGCLDRTAINFDPLATVDNGTCEYKPVECLKKRWFFSGCKPSKRICDCN